MYYKILIIILLLFLSKNTDAQTQSKDYRILASFNVANGTTYDGVVLKIVDTFSLDTFILIKESIWCKNKDIDKYENPIKIDSVYSLTIYPVISNKFLINSERVVIGFPSYWIWMQDRDEIDCIPYTSDDVIVLQYKKKKKNYIKAVVNVRN